MSEWISVKDRMPEPFVSILVHIPEDEPFPTVHEGYLTNDVNWYAAHYTRESDEITHWMPLPEPPKEAEKAEAELINGLSEMNRRYYERQIILEEKNMRLRKALRNARTDVCVKCGQRVDGVKCQECEYLDEMPKEVE